jgi:hypothetical protein
LLSKHCSPSGAGTRQPLLAASGSTGGPVRYGLYSISVCTGCTRAAAAAVVAGGRTRLRCECSTSSLVLFFG